MSKNKALAVIGSGYGDEGKGLMTDILASRGADVVVRSNGGAQAGHTVQTPDGVRHVFHHFGSGALVGVPTHLSQYYVSHPMLLMQEFEQLIELKAKTVITVDPRSIITTPYDMMINQFIETRRANSRHGSCGVGFGEAIERSERPDLQLTAGDLFSRKDIKDILNRIRNEWVPERIRLIGGGSLTEQEAELVANDNIFERYIEDCLEFLSVVGLRDDAALKGNVIFEGAQGLMLDQDYGSFPHVTRSNTGLNNMAKIAIEAGIKEIDATYMTRAYKTRHGAGPLEHEGVDMSFVEVIDPTNIHNNWQGSLRFAPLDAHVLKHAIQSDLQKVSSLIRVNAGLAITCADQVVDNVIIHEANKRALKLPVQQLSSQLNSLTGFPIKGVSWGPTRDDYVEAGN